MDTVALKLSEYIMPDDDEVLTESVRGFLETHRKEQHRVAIGRRARIVELQNKATPSLPPPTRATPPPPNVPVPSRRCQGAGPPQGWRQGVLGSSTASNLLPSPHVGYWTGQRDEGDLARPGLV
jgi:hypothetical protein